MASMILTPLKSARSDLEKIELEVGRRCIISSSARKVAQLPIKKSLPQHEAATGRGWHLIFSIHNLLKGVNPLIRIKKHPPSQRSPGCDWKIKATYGQLLYGKL